MDIEKLTRERMEMTTYENQFNDNYWTYDFELEDEVLELHRCPLYNEET